MIPVSITLDRVVLDVTTIRNYNLSFVIKPIHYTPIFLLLQLRDIDNMSGNTVSPFRISSKHLDDLTRNNAFTAVRDHLRRQELGMNAPR